MLDIYKFEFDKELDNLPTMLKKGAGVVMPPQAVYCNNVWQTGDFAHFYAAILSDLHNGMDQILFLIPTKEAELPHGIFADINFALNKTCEDLNRTVKVVILIVVDIFSGSNLGTWRDILKLPVYGPMDATKRASGLIKAMRPGDRLTPLWASLVRGERIPFLQDAYAEACRLFAQEFFSGQKFPKDLSNGAKFVCIWDRNVPLKGGANPHYNSSKTGNDQICCGLVAKIPDLSAVLLIGTEYHSETRFRPKAFSMGGFWAKLPAIQGRLSQNAFFDYMTTTYSCDVVHVGMKSGGMDSLAMLGQKVVFIDYSKMHEMTRERIEHLRTDRFRYVEVNELPSVAGKAIVEMRAEDDKKGQKHRIKTTITKSSTVKDVKAKVEEITSRVERLAHYPGELEHLQNSFSEADLQKIVNEVKIMFD